MARKIIILEKLPGLNRYTYACWLDVPVARRPFYLNGATSIADASIAEKAQFAAGELVEKVQVIELPIGTTLAQAQAAIISEYNDLQSALNSYNPWTRYGTSWDGATWTAGGVV